MIQASGSGKQELSTESISQVVLKMKALPGSNNMLLTSALNNLRIKLQTKLESSKGIEEQAKLANAYGVLIQQLVSVSSDVAILNSAGSFILKLASKMLKDPSLATNGKTLMPIAETAFTKIAAMPASEQMKANAKPEEFQYKLAQAKSGAGKFEEAHALFLQSLTTTPVNNITFQVEAARNLQSWANDKDMELLKKAIEGAEPNAKKINVIWGWGKISEATSKNLSKFKDIYFEARLNIAKCARAIALLEPSPEKKKQLMERALNKIRETHLIYPELGSPEIKASFEKLLREMQRDLGKPIAGLKEFS